MRELRLCPQSRRLLSFLEKGGVVTLRSALMDHGIASLTKRISEIRQEGFRVKGKQKHNPTTGQKYTQYSMGKAS